MAGKIDMRALDMAMQFTSYPIKKYLLSNYPTNVVSSDDLADDYNEYIGSINMAFDAGKNVKISIDLVPKDYKYDLSGYDESEIDTIASQMAIIRMWLDICTPLYCKRFNKDGSDNPTGEKLPEHFKCDDSNYTYYLEPEHNYRLGFVLE
jgi:hypothetical protein